MILLVSGIANAAERYTEARILQVETSDNSIIVFLDVVSGDTPPHGNGGSNESIKPYLLLANSPSDIANRNHVLATALMAHSAGSVVRFRWEDAGANAGRVVVMLLRQ